jgi:hypothetical protein
MRHQIALRAIARLVCERQGCRIDGVIVARVAFRADRKQAIPVERSLSSTAI